MNIHKTIIAIPLLACAILSLNAHAQQLSTSAWKAEGIIIDTDIGGDIDDAFAVALALASPEVNILGITTVAGTRPDDTEVRARIADRMLAESGRTDIPVAAGLSAPPTQAWSVVPDVISQRRYADGGHVEHVPHRQAVKFIEETIRRNPGEVTVVALGALTNIAAVLADEPATFHKLKRIVMMGGSVEHGYCDPEYVQQCGAEPEANIIGDIAAAKKVFSAGVPLYVMPLDSTANLMLDEVKREILFSRDTARVDPLVVLYHQWAFNTGRITPVLYDPMALVYVVRPTLCPVQPMHIRVDDQGYTRAEPGSPNAQVCLHSNAEAFFSFYLGRLLAR